MAKKKTSKLLHRYQTRLHNAWILKNLPRLDEAELKVYIVLAMHAHWEKGWAFPRFEKIAQETGLTYGLNHQKPNVRRIRKAIRGLEEKGLIDIEFRRPKNKKGQVYGRKRYFYRLKHPSDVEYFAEQ